MIVFIFIDYNIYELSCQASVVTHLAYYCVTLVIYMSYIFLQSAYKCHTFVIYVSYIFFKSRLELFLLESHFCIFRFYFVFVLCLQFYFSKTTIFFFTYPFLFSISSILVFTFVKCFSIIHILFLCFHFIFVFFVFTLFFIFYILYFSFCFLDLDKQKNKCEFSHLFIMMRI